MDMVGVLEFESTGEYRDERLYILETIKRLEKKLEATVAELAVSKSDLVKFRADLNEAHGRIRTLLKVKDDIQRRLLRMEVKAGSIATLAGVLAAGAIEALKHYVWNR